jgi:hypothetical protein
MQTRDDSLFFLSLFSSLPSQRTNIPTTKTKQKMTGKDILLGLLLLGHASAEYRSELVRMPGHTEQDENDYSLPLPSSYLKEGDKAVLLLEQLLQAFFFIVRQSF